MIKNFEEYINEDYFSRLASRKDNGSVRKENEVNDEVVRSYMYPGSEFKTKSISFRKENGGTFVDIDGSFYLRKDAEEIPFQFGTVTGDFDCCDCKKLTSLKGCPKEVCGIFNCYKCTSLKSLEGCPEIVDGDFYCFNCGKQFTKEEVKSLCDVKGKIYV